MMNRGVGDRRNRKMSHQLNRYVSLNSGSVMPSCFSYSMISRKHLLSTARCFSVICIPNCATMTRRIAAPVVMIGSPTRQSNPTKATARRAVISSAFQVWLRVWKWSSHSISIIFRKLSSDGFSDDTPHLPMECRQTP